MQSSTFLRAFGPRALAAGVVRTSTTVSTTTSSPAPLRFISRGVHGHSASRQGTKTVVAGVATSATSSHPEVQNASTTSPTYEPATTTTTGLSNYKRRDLHDPSSSSSTTAKNTPFGRPSGSNPAMSFPCVDQNESRTQRLLQERDQLLYSSSIGKGKQKESEKGSTLINLPNLPSTSVEKDDPEGPEPAYAKVVSGYSLYHHQEPFALDYGGHLPKFSIAYETWGTLNPDRSNVVLLHTGLSASSHAHSTPENPSEGWWEKFIGPGKSIDTDKFFVICTNVLGGCYGSTGPSSLDPSDGEPYATRFPVLSIFDMVRAQFHLLSELGIKKLYASVGSSMGGMQSIAAAYLEPDRVGKVVSISGTARSSPASIAMRHAQRSVLMADPNWKRGFYYDNLPPHIGMKLARQIATITYRSGPEWEQRFGRRRRNNTPPSSSSNLSSPPVLCPDFLIETYLDHQGEQFCLKYDANSLIYISKAMDLFDMSQDSLDDLAARRRVRDEGQSSQEALCWISPSLDGEGSGSSRANANVTPATTMSSSSTTVPPRTKTKGGLSNSGKGTFISSLSSSHAYLPALSAGLSKHAHPTLVMGVQSDTLFPVEQQRELAECLKANGNSNVVYYELNQPWGHDTFLLDVSNVGSAIRGFLENDE